MGVIKKKVRITSTGEEGHSSDEELHSPNVDPILIPSENVEVESDTLSPPIRPSRPPPSPFGRRRPTAGRKLVLKKGRRSRHRYENERRLFGQAEYGLDENEDDESRFEGWDISEKHSKSPFSNLLENHDLLEKFVENREFYVLERKKDEGKDQRPRNEFNPEESFLSMGYGLRVALKKHLPWGMLESLEEEIRSFFFENPKSEFVSEDLSSFERLLAHACSAYNNLQSRSYDDGGKRKLKIENPSSNFRLLDPSLSEYLKERSNH